MEKDGKTCTLYIKECRPDDECEYACGVDDKRSRARLFVEGSFATNTLLREMHIYCNIVPTSSVQLFSRFFFLLFSALLLFRDPSGNCQTPKRYI